MSVIARFYWDENQQGNEFPITSSQLEYPDLGVYGVQDKFSSCAIYDLMYNIFIYDGVNYTGKVYILRYPMSVMKFSDYGFENSIKSIKIVPNNGTKGQVILSRELNNTGKSLWLISGFYANLSVQPIGDNQVSSLYLYPKTQVFIFKDNYYLNLLETHTNNDPVQIQSVNLQNVKQASSIIVYIL